MAYTTCIVSSCKTRRNPNTLKSEAVKCFSFPKDPALRKEWLDLCQVQECETSDSSKKVCIKHFVESDFEDGLKARLMNLQPRILKKYAVPSLHLIPAEENGNCKGKRLKKDVERLEKILKRVQKEGCKPRKRTLSKDKPKEHIGQEYLSNLVPIAPKGLQLTPTMSQIAQKMPIITLDAGSNRTSKGQRSPIVENELMDVTDSQKYLEQDNTMKTANKIQEVTPEKVTEVNVINLKDLVTEHKFKRLKQDITVYQKRINELLFNEEKLQKKVKELEAKIKYTESSFNKIVKDKFAHCLSSAQLDIMLGKQRPTWSDLELAKSYILYHISKKAYLYIKESLCYPLPALSTMAKWLSKMGEELVPNDTGIVPPLPENIQSIFNKIQQESVDKNDYKLLAWLNKCKKYGIKKEKCIEPKVEDTLDISKDGVCQSKVHFNEFNVNLDIAMEENICDINNEGYKLEKNYVHDKFEPESNKNVNDLNNYVFDHNYASNNFNPNFEGNNKIDGTNSLSEDFESTVEFHEVPLAYHNAQDYNMVELSDVKPSFVEEDNG